MDQEIKVEKIDHEKRERSTSPESESCQLSITFKRSNLKLYFLKI